jgi:hypothetical protein
MLRAAPASAAMTADALRKAAVHLERGELAAAELFCRQVLETGDPAAQALAHNLLGVIAGQLGLATFARTHFEHALAADPDLAVAAKNLQRTPLPAATPQAAGPRYLLIKAWGYGFWSDVNHVLGCLLLAELTGRIPVTHWGPNSLFSDGSDTDAFRHFFEPVSICTIDDLPTLPDTEYFPPKWNAGTLRRNELLTWEGPGSRLTGLYFLNRPETIAVSDFYTGVVDLLPWIPPTHPLHGLTIDAVYRHLIERHLKPAAAIAKAAADFWAARLQGPPTVAVHLRGSDKVRDTPDIDEINERYFDTLLDADPRARIFFMTDDTRWADIFRQTYGDRLVLTDAERTGSETGVHLAGTAGRVQLGQEVLLDSLIALRADRFIGNGASNVSAMIAVLKDWPTGACTLVAPSVLHRRREVLLTG